MQKIQSLLVKIGDFTYSDFKGRLFNIQYDQSKYYIPEAFFKYYSLSHHGVNALVNAYIYASHPNQLNDPFDCDKDIISFDDELTTRKLLGDLYDNLKGHFSPSEFAEFVSKAFNTIVYRKCGILSLATNPLHPLMWAHYAGKDGFCIEFNVEEFPFKYYGPFPVNYVETLPTIKTSQASISQAMAIQCSVKHSLWSYEDEWRIIVPSPNGYDMKSYGYWSENMNNGGEIERKFVYPIRAIKRIILGAEFISPQNVIEKSNNVIRISDFKDERFKILHHIAVNRIRTSLLLKQNGGRFDTFDVDIQEVNNQSFIISEL